MTGPLQVIALSFGPGAEFQGRVVDEIDRLQGRGVLRLLDVLFAAKSDDGSVEQVVVRGDDDFGTLLASILPFGGRGLSKPRTGESSSGFDPADAWTLADSLVPGTSLAFLLVEHGWAEPLFDAIDETGGTLVGEGFLTAEAGLIVGAEVAALEEAAEVIAAAQAAEVEATLQAIAAGNEAAEAVAASEAIRAAAAAEAIRALIVAGLVEEAAAHEAVEALSAAGLITAAVDAVVAKALAGDVALVEAADDDTAVALAEDAELVRAADAAAAEDIEAAEDAAAEAIAADEDAVAEAIEEDDAEVTAANAAAAEAVTHAAATVRAASITTAEAQVLRYLPTRSTFAVIADKLGISRSAAKERAERVYKKLGVHNRAEAVERARDLGILD